MKTDNWKPTDKWPEVITNEEGDELNVYDCTIEAYGGATYAPSKFRLPDNLRLCERVPDEPITAETLQRDGWERDSTILGIWKMKCTNALGETSYLFWNEERGNSDYPGCTTISQLRNLVEMLGGGA